MEAEKSFFKEREENRNERLLPTPFLKAYLFIGRERDHKPGRDRERGRESQAGSMLWSLCVEPDTGLELTNREIMT